MNYDLDSQISPFDRQKRIEGWQQAKLSDAKVLLLGVGALGNEVLKNLSLSGVGRFLVVDFDRIERSNLNRSVLFRAKDANEGCPKAKIAAARASALNPNKEASYRYIEGDIVWDLGLGVYRHADLVIGCVDNIEARISINSKSWRTGKTWIDGGTWGLAGSVAVFRPDSGKACYECGLTREHYQMARIRYSCTNTVARANVKQRFMPATQSTTAIIGGIQSQEAIRILQEDASFFGQRLMYNGSYFSHLNDNPPLYLMTMAINPECILGHENILSDVIELPTASRNLELADFLELLHGEFGPGRINIDLACPFIIKSICPLCQGTTDLRLPKSRLQDIDIVCPTCEVVCPSCGSINHGTPDCLICGQADIYEPRLESLGQIKEEDEQIQIYQRMRLSDLGVAPLEILRISMDSREYFVELTGNTSEVWG